MVKAQQVEIEILKRQLKKIKMKLKTFEKELHFLIAKKQKLSQHLGKYAPEIKNQVQLNRKQKNPDNSTKATKEKICLIATPGDKKSTPTPYFSLAKNTQKQSYVLVIASKPA